MLIKLLFLRAFEKEYCPFGGGEECERQAGIFRIMHKPNIFCCENMIFKTEKLRYIPQIKTVNFGQFTP